MNRKQMHELATAWVWAGILVTGGFVTLGVLGIYPLIAAVPPLAVLVLSGLVAVRTHQRSTQRQAKVDSKRHQRAAIEQQVSDKMFATAEALAEHEIMFGEHSMHGQAQRTIDHIDAELAKMERIRIAEIEDRRWAALTDEERMLEEQGKWTSHQEAKMLQALGIPSEMAWDKIPGWTESDTERAKAHLEKAADFDPGGLVQPPIKLKRRPKTSWDW